MLISFNIAFYDRGKLIMDRRVIFFHNLKEKFFLDLITNLGLLMNIISPDEKIYYILFYVRFFEFNEIRNRLNTHFKLQHRFPETYEVTNLIIEVLLLAHFLGCIFYYIG